jgi:hypothetical protein
MVSGLPLLNKPMRTRIRLINEAFGLMQAGAPFVQFTYSMAPPIPKGCRRRGGEASELIWMNLPPARVWVLSRADAAGFDQAARRSLCRRAGTGPGYPVPGPRRYWPSSEPGT